MGFLTPSEREYGLITSFNDEAFKLLGQECDIYFISSLTPDSGRDNFAEYEYSLKSYILFETNLDENKTKNHKWSKETGSNIVAYVPLEYNEEYNGALVDITPQYYNHNSKFKISSVLSQVNSTYLKVTLVPYRSSSSVDLSSANNTDSVVEEDGIVKRKPYLKR